MQNKKVIFVMGLLFLFFSTAFISAEGIGGSGSSTNTPPGGKAKPSQDKIKGQSTGTPHKPKSIDLHTDDVPMPGTLSAGSPPIVYTQHIGMWHRKAVYINGILNHRTPATLTYKQNSFHASGTCSTSGTISVTEATIKTVMTRSSCPGGVKPPMTVIYSYKITKDNKKLILEAGPLREVYTR